MLVNRFVVENRRQVQRYQALSETLEETNRQLQRAEADARRSERLAALGQMSAGLAHEIRNPLGVIKGSAEMLVQKLKNPSPSPANSRATFLRSESPQRARRALPRFRPPVASRSAPACKSPRSSIALSNPFKPSCRIRKSRVERH